MAFNRRGAVGAKDDRARPRVKQPCQTFGEFKLFFFVKEVEEESGIDGGDVPLQFRQTAH